MFYYGNLSRHRFLYTKTFGKGVDKNTKTFEFIASFIVTHSIHESIRDITLYIKPLIRYFAVLNKSSK